MLSNVAPSCPTFGGVGGKGDHESATGLYCGRLDHSRYKRRRLGDGRGDRVERVVDSAHRRRHGAVLTGVAECNIVVGKTIGRADLIGICGHHAPGAADHTSLDVEIGAVARHGAEGDFLSKMPGRFAGS